jgi:hypothetical protein
MLTEKEIFRKMIFVRIVLLFFHKRKMPSNNEDKFTSVQNISSIVLTSNSIRTEIIYKDEDIAENDTPFKEVAITNCVLPFSKLMEHFDEHHELVTDEEIESYIHGKNDILFPNTVKDQYARDVACIISLIRQGTEFNNLPSILMNVGKMKWSAEDGNHRIRAYQYLKMDMPCDVVYIESI